MFFKVPKRSEEEEEIPIHALEKEYIYVAGMSIVKHKVELIYYK